MTLKTKGDEPMPRYNVSKKRGKSKIKISEKREAAMRKIVDSYSEEFDVKMSVIQELIPLGLKAVAEELTNEVMRLAGEKHSRGGNNARWGRQNGSVYLRDQKFGIRVPRVRDVEANQEVPLEAYRRLQKPFNDEESMRRLLHGLSTHKYQESSSLAAEAFGISASNLSKKFKKCSGDHLQQLQARSLAQYDIAAIFMDAKRYADDGIMVGLGVTMDGQKIVLGIEQIHSENGRAIEQWLDRLIERGLKFEEGILFIIDGSKGIKKAIEHKFSSYALIQRCRWHKRENIVAYLDETQQVVFRRRLQEAYAKTTYKEAKAALMQLHQELEECNASAANSLLEGLEETLTIHHLGLSPELTRSLSTTNCIEGVMSQLGSYTDKVDRWHNSDQILRWTGMGLMDIEPRLHRIHGHRYIKVLRYKIQEIVRQRLQKESAVTGSKIEKVSLVDVTGDR
jgi:transposase-like protein